MSVTTIVSIGLLTASAVQWAYALFCAKRALNHYRRTLARYRAVSEDEVFKACLREAYRSGQRSRDHELRQYANSVRGIWERIQELEGTQHVRSDLSRSNRQTSDNGQWQ